MKIISDKVQDGVRIVTAATEGVCSVQINLAFREMLSLTQCSMAVAAATFKEYVHCQEVQKSLT